MTRPSIPDWRLSAALFRAARPSWPLLAVILAVDLLSAPLTLLTPLPLKLAVDSVLGSRPLPRLLGGVLGAGAGPGATLAVVAILIVAIALLVHLQGLAVWLLQTYTGQRLVLRFRARLFMHVQRLSIAYHDRHGAMDATYRIQYDAPAIQYVLVDGLIPFVTAAVTVASMIVVTARLDRLLAVVAIAIAPVLFLLTRESGQRLRRRWLELKEVESAAMSVVQEALSALRVVKAFGRESHERDRFLRQAHEGVRGQVRVALIAATFDLLIGVTMAAGTAAVLVIGVRHVQSGALTLGGLLVVMAYLAQLYAPLQTLSKRIAVLQSSMASAERSFALLAEPADVVDRPGSRPLPRARGAIEFQDVSFGYDDARPVLQHVSFAVPPGARVGIVGTTGAGKTTLVSLLTRFYDPTAGRILLDGVGLRDYRLADLREQFAIVLQDSVLFSTSIAENIGYARPGAGRREVVAAAEAAGAHGFILGLSRGYETEVGDRGMRLSGGERQRIALARAFLKEAPILILDEPTSAVDTTTETAILTAMERLAEGRTTFIIAHRPSTLRSCDVILTIEDGRLVDTRPGPAAVVPVEQTSSSR